MPITDETRQRAREIVARYPKPRSALLPMLHLVQAEEGCVTPEGVALCAEELGLTKAEVGAVATFYTMYKRHPTGDWLVSVCTNLSCQILGGDEIFTCLSRHLGVGHDDTTPDGRFTLEHAECLAACDYAPVVTVNYEFFDNATPESALELVRALERGERPHPTRGEPLVTFREIERELAGFVPEAALAEATSAAGVAHPGPPRPVDSRGSVDLAGSELEPELTGYGVPGGETGSTVSAAEAAATYGAGGSADAAPGKAAGKRGQAAGQPGESAGKRGEEPGADPAREGA